MTSAGFARVRAYFANLIEVYPAGDPLNEDEDSPSAQSRYLPQLPQLPQQLLEDRQQTKRRQLNLSPDAYVRLAAFCNRVKKSLGPDEAMAPIRGFVDKAAWRIVRNG